MKKIILLILLSCATRALSADFGTILAAEVGTIKLQGGQVDSVKLRADVKNEAVALAAKLEAGSVTAVEKDALIVRLCFLVLTLIGGRQ